MDSVLIVSAGGKAQSALVQLLRPSGYAVSASVQSGADARRLLLGGDFDLVLINTPLSDEFGHELAVGAATGTGAGVLLIVRGEQADEVSARVEDCGVFVIPKPVSRQMFYQSLKLVAATRRRMLGLKSENVRLRQKIEEIRLVDRAKCALIRYLGMTEPQAHRYIEKQAMDLRLTRREISERILKTYES
ncbi:ANTAR domain-containing response regulator [Harryflintia acetispora]|uniref:Response regulator receiver and ANTAR domain protein n=1 Tax=Harryflintia acetispora TaxID=1849041 RepID=A0A9X8UKA7_9FIRM|nr:ANTAR domain-containing protein [Harryflintia acetispora]TCL44496.1 response regulator receiver and ANTAR domain protein [Harryflintia acetispora]